MTKTSSKLFAPSSILIAVLLAGCSATPNGPTDPGSPNPSDGQSGWSDQSPTGPGRPGGSQPAASQPAGAASGTATSTPPAGSGSPGSAGPAAVSLGSAAGFAILAKPGISTTGTTSVVGDMGVSPIESTAITGFGLVMDASNQYSTSSLVTGRIYAADYSPPAPTQMTQAISDMQTAYADAAGRTNPTATELGAGSIGGMTLSPGLYKWGTGVLINTDLVLSGGSNDVWIFQVAQTLSVASGVKVTLAGGAKARNVYWQVADQATLGTTCEFKGNILSYTAIVLGTGASLSGRALAQTAVTLEANAVTKAA